MMYYTDCVHIYSNNSQFKGQLFQCFALSEPLRAESLCTDLRASKKHLTFNSFLKSTYIKIDPVCFLNKCFWSFCTWFCLCILSLKALIKLFTCATFDNFPSSSVALEIQKKRTVLYLQTQKRFKR